MEIDCQFISMYGKFVTSPIYHTWIWTDNPFPYMVILRGHWPPTISVRILATVLISALPNHQVTVSESLVNNIAREDDYLLWLLKRYKVIIEYRCSWEPFQISACINCERQRPWAQLNPWAGHSLCKFL